MRILFLSTRVLWEDRWIPCIQARLLLKALVLCLVATTHSTAQIIADFRDDFRSGTPLAGWSYYWNAPEGLPEQPDHSSSFLTSSGATFTDLVSVESKYTPNGDLEFSDEAPSGFLFLEKTGGHPGLGGLEVRGGPVGIDRYAIASYTVPSSGFYRLTATSIGLSDTRSNGIRLVVMEPGPDIHFETVVYGTQTSTFDCDLGRIQEGGEILVAVGANGHSGFDTFTLDYSIEKYVPDFEEYYLEDFGAVGDGVTDDGPALRAAAAAMSNSNKPRVLHFGHGRHYRMGRYAVAHGTMVFREADNLILEGNGSTIINHPENRTFTFYRSDSLTVRNLFLDMDPLPFTQGRILAVNPEANSLDLEIEPGYADPVIGSGFLDHPDNDVILYDGSTREPIHRFDRKREVIELGNGIFRLFFHGSDLVEGTRPGDLVTVKNNGDTFDGGFDLRDADGSYIRPPVGLIYASFCDKLTLEGITNYASPTMVMATWDCDGLKIRRFENLRKPGTNRLTSGNKDILHLKRFKEAPQIQDCRFDSTNDDAINISQPTASILEIGSDQRVRVQGDDLFWYNLPVSTGDTLFHYNEERAFGGEYRVTAVESINRREAWIEVSPAFQQMPALGDFICPKPESPARIQRCEFTRMFQRAMLVRVPCLIEDIRQQGGSAAFPPRISRPEGPSPHEQNLYRSILSGSDPDFDQSVRIMHQFNRPGNYSARVVDNVIYRNRRDSVPVGFYNADGIEYKGNNILYPEPSSTWTYVAVNTGNLAVGNNRSLVGEYDPDGDGWPESSAREAYFPEAHLSPIHLFGGSYGSGPWMAGDGISGYGTNGGEIRGTTIDPAGYLENSDTWIHGATTKRVIVLIKTSTPGTATLQWRSQSDSGFDAERSLSLPIAGGDGFETLLFEVAASPGWKPDWMRAFRLGPIDSEGRDFSIRAICFSAGDADGDGIADLDEGSMDTDQDGLPDLLDRDSDGDGIPDGVEAWRDSNGDGTLDRYSNDSDGDGIPDWFEWNRRGFDPIRPHWQMVNSQEQSDLYSAFVSGSDHWRQSLQADVTDGSVRIRGKVGAGRTVSLQRARSLRSGWLEIARFDAPDDDFLFRDDLRFSEQFYRAAAFLDDTHVLAHDGFHGGGNAKGSGSGYGFNGGFRPSEGLLINASSELSQGLDHGLKVSSGHSYGLTLFGPELSRATFIRGLDLDFFSGHSTEGEKIDTGTLYVSWLYRPGQVEGSFLDRFVLLQKYNEVWSLRFQQVNRDYQLRVGDDDFGTAVQPQASRTDLFVLRVDCNPDGEDLISLYINPPGFSEPSTPLLQVNGDFSFDGFLLERLGFEATSRWDEITFASSFKAAVLGATPP